MKKIAGQMRQYWTETNKAVFGFSALFTAVLVFINFRFGLNQKINSASFGGTYVGWYVVFLSALAVPYWLVSVFKKEPLFAKGSFVLLLLIAPAIFSWKMAASPSFFLSANEGVNAYWNAVLYWPVKLVVVMGCLLVVWKLFSPEQPFYGFSTKGFSIKPYLLMLAFMVPLIAAASFQPDFLNMYPKMATLQQVPNEAFKGFYQFLYELSYGSDFLGIELFFRGFLVLAFLKYAGKEAILPMAVFYCTIHFGKPLAECISSFFGGLVLGVVTYHTRSIWGGLIVHLGIAWLMELGGFLGRLSLN